jgi:hypothetical protein
VSNADQGKEALPATPTRSVVPAVGCRWTGSVTRNACVNKVTVTGDGNDLQYWNRYVGVTQMGGHGSFSEPRIGVNVTNVTNGPDDQVSAKLPALQAYQLSIPAPVPPAGSYELVSEPEPNGAPSYASRSATKKYRTAPLHGLWQHPPYFHNGVSATLDDVVERSDARKGLQLTADQKSDLVQFLKSL